MNGSITKYPQKNGRFSWGYHFRVANATGPGKWKQVTKQGFATKREAQDALREA
jgi:hypothetical protein